ncbi:hypothetical protein SmJEL517_g04180 [Synchytrium microbalum]|uniref:rhizopuspepsin n=1 Tax=Synchytrium microbalum TaxID=1806994 RepID=A0A507C148_9FUNG|nr:uncharacterized protein SmJEL517_g04180 [Synchytrium microbalum]TPX32779.1 hypothetical protein SmJEL517_g04180 [Synchytrium microbalum]
MVKFIAILALLASVAIAAPTTKLARMQLKRVSHEDRSKYMTEALFAASSAALKQKYMGAPQDITSEHGLPLTNFMNAQASFSSFTHHSEEFITHSNALSLILVPRIFGSLPPIVAALLVGCTADSIPPSLQPSKQTFAIQYGTGSLEGIISNDVLTIGDLEIEDQDFGESVKEPGITFAVGRFDGILGLGFDNIAVQRVVPPFYQMVNQKLVDSPLFSVWLNTNGDDNGGEIVFGGMDKAHYTGEITYAPVTRKGYWEVEIEDVLMGGKSLGFTTKKAAIDTGSSLFALPTSEADAINQRIGGKKNPQGQYIVDCAAIPSLPSLDIQFGGTKFTLSGKSLF